MRHHLPWPQNDITATCDGLPIQETLDFWLFLSATLENVTECDLNTLQDEWLLTWQALKQNTTRAYFWIKKNLTCSFPPGLMCWFDGYKLGHLWQQLQKKNFISFGFCCSISRSRCRTRANVNRCRIPPPPWTADWSTLARKRRAMASASNIANLLDFQGIRTKGRFCSYLNSVDDKWFMFTNSEFRLP
jgi:hypothetical protein